MSWGIVGLKEKTPGGIGETSGEGKGLFGLQF